MTHSPSEVLISVSQIIQASGISRKTFERWRDAVYEGVGDPPYTQDELKIILEYGIKKSARAFGASRNKNSQKISKILKIL